MAKNLSKSTFIDFVNNSSGKVVVDFWAPWCGPCLLVAPVLDELEKESSGGVVLGKVNTDENQELASEYNIQSIPTIMIFENGKLKQKLIGAHPKHIIQAAINS